MFLPHTPNLHSRKSQLYKPNIENYLHEHNSQNICAQSNPTILRHQRMIVAFFYWAHHYTYHLISVEMILSHRDLHLLQVHQFTPTTSILLSRIYRYSISLPVNPAFSSFMRDRPSHKTLLFRFIVSSRS
jgi:hypothetical protein